MMKQSTLISWHYFGAERVSVHVEAWGVSELWSVSFWCSKLEGLSQVGQN